jgi:hypothetical protein
MVNERLPAKNASGQVQMITLNEALSSGYETKELHHEAALRMSQRRPETMRD